MTEAPAPATLVSQAETAMARGAWSDAYAVLREANAESPLSDRPALLLLAQSAYLAGNLDPAMQAFEKVHTSALAAGDVDAAAGAASQVAFILFDAVQYTASRAWLRRAERLIEGRPDSPARAFTRMLRAYLLLVEGDFDGTVELAHEAQVLADASGDRDISALARIAEGRALISRGDVEDGLALLDELSVAAVSGELGAAATGAVYCQANCAYQSVSDYERAEEWTRAMETWSATAGLTTFQGRCRLHRAQLKRLHGDWKGAAAEAQRASEELGSVVPAERGWAISELGLIRLRLGDLAGSETAFLEAHAAGWEPEPGLSLLRLAQGRVSAAVAGIRDALARADEVNSREVPPHGALRRAPLLAAQVEIAIAAGDLPTAEAAVGELESVAATYRTKALRATAAGARGALDLARRDFEAAGKRFQTALGLWQSLDAPYEVARSRMGLADAATGAGNDDKAALEYRAALNGFHKLQATLDARRAAAAAPGLADPAATGQRLRRTFMFTDIVQSTDLLGAMGDDAWRQVLRWHGDTLARLIETDHGTVVSSTGDGYFAAFEQESEAVAAAVAIQRALEEHRQTAGYAPHVRIGLHAAEADLEADNWSGMGVHAAARIGALAAGDEILASQGTAAGAVGTTPSGEPRTVTLKGIRDPVSVVTIDWR